MKKLIYLLLLVFVFKLPAINQTTTWTDSFNSGQEWLLEENWIIADGKLEFYWSPEIPDFDLSAVSPVITLPENVYDLTVTQYLDVFEGTGSEYAEIRLIVAGNPVVLWNYNLIEGNWGLSGGEDISFTVGDYAGQDVQIEFRTYGQYTYYWNWWDIMEVKVSTFFSNDLTVTSISGPNILELQQTGTWTVNVMNQGSEVQDQFSVKLFDYKSGNQVGSIENPGSIGTQQNMTLNFDWSSDIAYNTAFYGVVVSDGDQYVANNASKSRFLRIEPDLEYHIYVWDNDNGIPTIIDPEKGDEIEPSKGMTKALEEAGLEFDSGNSLPGNINFYDVIFSTMGCYCFS